MAIATTDPETFGDSGTEALDEAIGPLDQLQERLDALGRLEVEPDRTPPTVERVAGRQGRIPAANLRRPVDADHVGAHVGQHHRRERTRADAGHLDDLQP